MSDTLLRQMIILQNLPQHPRKISTRSLLEVLAAQGIKTTIRTVQRDLESLSSSGMFGISADKNSKPAGWYWLKQSRQLQIPYMDVSTAIAFSLIETEADSILPNEIKGQLEPFFRQSQDLLKERNDWTQKISRATPKNNSVIAISEDDKRLIYQALENQLCFSAQVGRFLKGLNMQYMHYSPIHPIGLHLDQNEIYLACHFGIPKRITLMSLYRFRGVELLNQQADTSRLSELSQDCEKRLNEVFHLGVDLEAKFEPCLLKDITLNPFTENQVIETTPDGAYRLKAQINDDRLLRQRLIRYGAHITVYKPQSIAAIIRREALKTLMNYKSDSTN